MADSYRLVSGRRAAREAKQRFERDRGERGREDRGGRCGGLFRGEKQPDAGVIVARVHGRGGWLFETRLRLDEDRRRETMPIPRSRAGRLLTASRC